MKRKILISYFILSGCIGLSQPASSFFSIRGGFSIPTGKYAGKDSEQASFTVTGFNTSIDGAWFFRPFLGIGGQAGFNLHPVDVSTLGWVKVQNDPFLQDVTIRSEPYQIITGAAGIYGAFSFWKKFSLQGKLLGGWMWGKTPYQLYKPQYFLTGPDYFEITSAKDKSPMFLGGVGIQYNISSCVGLKAEGEYIASDLSFRFQTATGIRVDQKPVRLVNLTLGLIINL